MSLQTPLSDLFVSERPRERCLSQGPKCLSLRECIALILGSGPRGKGCLGLAKEVLHSPGEGLASEDEERAFFTAMEVSGTAHLKGLSGLGAAGQARILAAFELGRRYALYRERTKSQGRSRHKLDVIAKQALERINTDLRNEPQEWLGFVPLYRSGDLGELCLVERGVRTHVNIDPAELFARLLALRPSGFFLFHNHPLT